MTKRNNEIETAIPETNISLREIFEKYPNISLRKVAGATDVSYGVLLKASKAPVAGELYDPERLNWDAVEDVIARKKIDLSIIDWNELNKGRPNNGVSLIKDMESFNVGDKVYLRRNNTTPYEIVYKTDSHVVILLEGTSDPVAWAHNTFLINGPVFEPRAVTNAEA